MMHVRYPLLVAALLLLATTPPLRADTQRVEGLVFDRVEIFGAVDVEVTQGEMTELRLRGDSEDLARQPFYLRGDTLVLGRSASNSRDNFDGVKYKLTLRDVNYIGLKGSGEVYVKPLENPELHFVLEGSGDLRIHDLRGKEISLVVSGSGDIQAVEIEAEQLRLALSGSGDIQVHH